MAQRSEGCLFITVQCQVRQTLPSLQEMLRITAKLCQSTAEESAEKGLSATRYAATVNAHAREELDSVTGLHEELVFNRLDAALLKPSVLVVTTW